MKLFPVYHYWLQFLPMYNCNIYQSLIVIIVRLSISISIIKDLLVTIEIITNYNYASLLFPLAIISSLLPGVSFITSLWSIAIITRPHYQLQLLPIITDYNYYPSTTTDCDFYHLSFLTAIINSCNYPTIISNNNYCTTISTNYNYYHSTINNYNDYKSIFHNWNYYQSVIVYCIYQSIKAAAITSSLSLLDAIIVYWYWLLRLLQVCYYQLQLLNSQ